MLKYDYGANMVEFLPVVAEIRMFKQEDHSGPVSLPWDTIAN